MLVYSFQVKNLDGKSASSKHLEGIFRQNLLSWIELLIELFRFPVVLSLLYGRKYFENELIEAANEYVEDIRDALIDIITEASWLDHETQDAAIQKAKTVKAFIGYPNESIEIGRLDAYYKDLEMQSDNFLLNSLRFEVFDLDKYFKMLREPVEKLSLGSLSVLDLADVNAYNQPSENSIRMF